jgi:hypothetical protein
VFEDAEVRISLRIYCCWNPNLKDDSIYHRLRFSIVGILPWNKNKRTKRKGKNKVYLGRGCGSNSSPLTEYDTVKV